MACRSVDWLRHTCGRSIPMAIIGRAKEGATLCHLAWNPNLGICGIVTLLLGASAWIVDSAARLINLRVLLVPVRGPLPNIARHVIEPEAIGRIGTAWRSPLVTILQQVTVRKLALPGVGHVPAAWREFSSPDELGRVEPTTRGKFPHGLARQVFARPLRVCFGVLEGDVDDRMIAQLADRTCRSSRMTPVGAANIDPPVICVADVHRPRRLLENNGGGSQQLRLCPRIICGACWPLSKGHVASFSYEAGEFAIGHRPSIHPEAAHSHRMRWGFFWVMVVGTHQKCSA